MQCDMHNSSRKTTFPDSCTYLMINAKSLEEDLLISTRRHFKPFSMTGSVFLLREQRGSHPLLLLP
jgi:hypothetical protein